MSTSYPGIDVPDPALQKATRLGMVPGIAQEFLQRSQRQWVAGNGIARGNRVHRGTQPVQRQFVRAVHRAKNSDQGARVRRGELFPRGAGLGVASAFGPDGANDLDGFRPTGSGRRLT